MKNKLTLEINDFAHINNAKIDIGKINIVVGKNASGKSTISKFLYSIIAPFCKEGNEIFEEFITLSCDEISEDLIQYVDLDSVIYSTYKKLKDLGNNLITIEECLNQNIIEELFKTEKLITEKTDSTNLQNYIIDLAYLFLLFKVENQEIKHSELAFQFLRNEFGNDEEIFFKWNKSKINMYSEDKNFEFNMNLPLVNVEVNSLENVEKNNLPYIKGNPLINDIIYIETPYILDLASNIHDNFSVLKKSYYVNNIINGNFLFHQRALLKKLYSKNQQKKLRNQSNSSLLDLFNLFDGEINFDKDKDKFEYIEKDNKFSMAHTASGIKSIGILQMLIENNLDTNSLIIMDEPEVHLHPEWQVKFAELIVELSKKGNIAFYINSHSPQFIEAIETYSKFHEYSKEVNYYLAEKSEKYGDMFDINPINNEDLIRIYDNLGDPYDELDKVQGKIIAKNLK